jgi:multiple sugar transport system permease protein
MAVDGRLSERRQGLRSLNAREALIGYLFIAPAFISLAVWWIWPIIYSIYLSLTRWDFMSPVKKWVGPENYVRIATHAEFHRVLWNTVYFSLGSVLLALVFGLILALILNQKLRGISLYRAFIFSPWITPTVAASLVWLWLYNKDMGLFNDILSLLGLSKVDWIGSGQGLFRLWAMPALILFTVWKTTGYNMVYFLAGLMSIPSELYEAAEIDGAGQWSKFRHVTLPMLSPMTFFIMVVSLIGAFNAFDQIRVITQGGPGDATRTIVYYLYQNAFQYFEVGYGSAVAIILLILLLVLTLIQFRMASRWVHYG